MKKILTTALILAAALALTACGSKGDNGLTTGDGTGTGIPAGTAPVTSDNTVFSPDVTELTTPDAESTEPTSSETTTETSETTAEPAVTTVSESTTKATTTTPKPETTKETTTTPAPATTPAPGQGETEDVGDGDIIDNIDEFLASIGIIEGDDISANE